MRLRPDDTRKQLVGFWLARAIERCPGVQLGCVMQMGNHIHLILRDDAGELAKLMEYFIGNLARDLNRLDGERGQVFERRYTPIEIVDDAALTERIAYTMANPASANLVETHRQWPGICGLGGDLNGRVFTRPALTLDHRKATSEPEHAVFRGLDLDDRSAALRAIDAAEAEARTARGVTRVLGADAARDVDPWSRPRSSKRSPRPLCHASTPGLWHAFRDSWKRFVANYRAASAAFLRGVLSVPFPAHSIRPHSPVAPCALLD